jgi:RHS repeat-associated protein
MTFLYPSLQSTVFSYYNNQGDQRLQEILNSSPSATQLSKFDYQYDVLGRITQWTQHTDSATPNVMALEYDPEGQLLNALITPQGQSATKAYTYAHDSMGNRKSEQIDTMTPSQVSTVTASSYNTFNQLTSRSGTGSLPVRFKGTVNEPATVTVAGQAAKMANDPASLTKGKTFTASLDLQPGSQNVAVVATDFGRGSGNVTTKNYSLTVNGGTSKTFTYDDNGNCTGNGSVTYEWDAEDRLTAINNGTLRTEFTYDGFGRRVKIREKNNNATTGARIFSWDGATLCREAHTTSIPLGPVIFVIKDYYAEGFFVTIEASSTTTASYFYTRDHLGSIREVTDSAGTIRARYDYDPYGRRSPNQITSNPIEADFGFTGHYYHAPSGLHLALYRAYDADVGRWLSRDPIEEGGGLNLYGYLGGDPVNRADPLGLTGWTLYYGGYYFGPPPSGGDSFPIEDVANFGAGLGDSLSFGATRAARNAFPDAFSADTDSGAYTAGEVTSFVIGSGRLLYAGAAKCLGVIRSPNLLDRARKISRARNKLKDIFRLGMFKSFRKPTFEELLNQKGSAEAVIS